MNIFIPRSIDRGDKQLQIYYPHHSGNIDYNWNKHILFIDTSFVFDDEWIDYMGEVLLKLNYLFGKVYWNQYQPV